MGILHTAAWVGACVLAGAIIASEYSGPRPLGGAKSGTSMINAGWGGISKERLMRRPGLRRNYTRRLW